MNTTNLTEFAFRAGVNTTKKEMTSGGSYTERIKSASLKRVDELLAGTSNVTNLSTEQSWQGTVIKMAMQGIEFAYKVINEQLANFKYKRLSFDKERQAGIATFIIPTNKEERDLSNEELAINAFIKLVNKQHSFISYLGIDTNVLSEEHGALFYSILPFYRMSESLGQPISSPSSIDKQRVAISLFFKSAFPDALADINTEFQTESKWIELWKSSVQKKNYLNDFRAYRFIMMSLANLLWNLGYPVDPETGLPLSVDATIELFSKVELFLNQLLNAEGTINIKGLHNHHHLTGFIHKIEVHTKSLKAAFIEEQLNELNFNDILNNAHQTLRIMDRSIFELIYTRKNPISHRKEPYCNAAEEIAYTINYMNQLIIYNPDIMIPFKNCIRLAPGVLFVNPSPETIVDALIAYIRCSNDEKGAVLHELQKNKNERAIEFTQALLNFDKKFIRPVRRASKKELQVSLLHQKENEVALLTTRRLVPLITLVVENYRVNVDLPLKCYSCTKTQEGKETASIKYSGNEQVSEINQSAMSDGSYYEWKLSPFIEFEKDTSVELDNLPKYQYRFTEITQLLDLINEIVQNYRSFLQIKVFQQFLIKCLNKVKIEYDELEKNIAHIDRFLRRNRSISRTMQAILRPMTQNLASSIEAFSVATYNFNRVINSPEFIEKQKRILSGIINSIHQKFASLFNEDSGISSLIDHDYLDAESAHASSVRETTPSISHEDSSPGMSLCKEDSSKVIALRKLVLDIYEALSYQSKHTEKGHLVTNLLKLIDTKPYMTEANLKSAFKELVRITLSYRSTFFFQAKYAETRSAKVLIAALKNPELNRLLPLNLLLFKHNDPKMYHDPDAVIIQRLRSLRQENNWQEEVHQIECIHALD